MWVEVERLATLEHRLQADRVFGVDEAAVHEVAGVEQDENVGSDQRFISRLGLILRRWFDPSDYG